MGGFFFETVRDNPSYLPLATLPMSPRLIADMRRNSSRRRDYSHLANDRVHQPGPPERLSELESENEPPPLEDLTADEISSVAASVGSIRPELSSREWDAEQCFLFIHEGRPVCTTGNIS